VRVALLSLGCKVNQAENARIESGVLAGSHEVVGLADSPDVCVINTCTVTGKSDYQSRQLIRRACRTGARIIVTGCYAELNKTDIVEIDPEITIVPNDNKSNIISMITGSVSSDALSMSGSRTRYALKVQDGCDHACSYCIIPRARGASRSVGREAVIGEFRSALDAGYREIVLTGIHLGLYGRESGEGLAGLLRLMLGVRGDYRIRLSSLEVSEIDPELIEIFADSRICKHLHIPLQGGCDSLLRAMNRPYGTAEFASLIERLAGNHENLALGTDVIVGYPSETGEEFDRSLGFIESLPFTYMHVFPYSARPGTPASSLADGVGSAERKDRTGRMRQVGEKKKSAYWLKQVGRILEVLAETDDARGLSGGTTGNYLKALVSHRADHGLKGSLVRMRVVGLSDAGLTGELVF
jgi:threonylcarbamoyladenosine tRNA methylthiotransferase MtaB